MRRVELVRWRRAPLSIWDRYDWLIDRPCFCLSSRTTSSWVTSRPRPRRTPSTSRRKRTFSPSVILLLAISYCNQRSNVKRAPGLRVADPVQLGRSEQAEERSEEGRHPPLSIPSEWRNCEQVPERRVAQAVDESGLDTVWINERLTFPPGAAASLPRAEVETTMRSLDPLATLAFLAAATKQIALGTAVLNLPFRPALVTAKWLASVQDWPGGRVRIGVGPGR